MTSKNLSKSKKWLWAESCLTFQPGQGPLPLRGRENSKKFYAKGCIHFLMLIKLVTMNFRYTLLYLISLPLCLILMLEWTQGKLFAAPRCCSHILNISALFWLICKHFCGPGWGQLCRSCCLNQRPSCWETVRDRKWRPATLAGQDEPVALSAVTHTDTWRPASFCFTLSLSVKLCLSPCTCFFPDTWHSEHTQQIMLTLSVSLYLIYARPTLTIYTTIHWNPFNSLTTNDPISL